MTADFSNDGNGVTMFAYEFAKALNRKNIPQGFMTMSSGRGGRLQQQASPLSWTSFDGVKNIQNPKFQARLDELFLQYPHTDIAKNATAKHIQEVQAFVKNISNANNPEELPLAAPPFPQAGKSDQVKSDMIPTYAYNWCVSPLTPMAVAGVIWIPSEYNIGYTPANYASELEIYAQSLPSTYGQDKVQFIYAQPANSLAEGITTPNIPNAKSITLEKWPKSLKEIAIQLAGKAE